MLESNRPIDPVTLKTFLEKANNLLVTTPGPNLIERQLLAPEWLGWWIDYLKDAGKLIKQKGTITNIDNIKKITAKTRPTGVLFAGGFEGHPGHRGSVKYMEGDCHVRPIILLEQDSYIAGKDRKGPFLPLEVRLSMWSYYSKNIVVSVLPEPPKPLEPNEEDSLNIHYQKIFDQTGADYCFADGKDRLVETKTSRGAIANFTHIPHIEYVSTTERVQQLCEDF